MKDFQSLFETAPDATIVVSESGRIVLVNQQTERLFGYAREELLNQPVELLVPEKVRALHPAYMQAYFKNPSVRPMGTGRCLLAQTKNGSLIDVEISLSPRHTREGLFVTCTIRDISENRKLELQLRQSQKMEAIGRLAGGIAHDFNNLLTVILGRSDLLIRDTSLSEKARTNVGLIKETGERASRLIRQLLQFSRKQIIEPKILDLNLIVADTNEMLRQLIGEHISLSMKFQSKLGRIKADPGQLQQVIINLVLNSRDAMPAGGRIEIETRSEVFDESTCKRIPEAKPGPHIVFSVTDTGVGMDERTRTHVFEPFFTTKEMGKGTGLGLATVFGIIKQMGGHIVVRSEIGHGTTFTIYIPECESEATHALAPQNESVAGGSETILIVEDEALIADMLQQILEELGYNVLKALNGTEALCMGAEYKKSIDLLLTDIILPALNGQDVAKILKLTRPNMKVLFISGYTSDVIISNESTGDQTNFLEKPFVPDTIARKIREVLDGAKGGK